MNDNDSPLSVVVEELPEGVSVTLERETEYNDVLRFEYRQSIATVGCGVAANKLWATVYTVNPGDGPLEDMALLLTELKKYYSNHKYDFAVSFANTTILKAILYKLQIKEREKSTGVLAKA